ncbi:DUF1631 family protein [Thiocapsa marina]|nr:DUF1631 family protein [Thiocapsa marina]
MRGRVVADCVGLLAERLPLLWRALFAKLDDALNDLADKSTNDLSYRVYFDARAILVKQRQRLQSDFLRRVAQRAGHLVGRNRAPEPKPVNGVGAESAFGDLALLAESELEEILATENLVSKAESRYRSDLMEIDLRLSALMGWGEVGLEENPFAPSALCHAFRDTLAALPPFEPSVKLVVYKLFDRHVMDRLGDFYRTCARHLEPFSSEAAILSARGRPTSTPAMPTRGIPSSRERPSSSSDSLSVPFDALRTLLARQRPIATASKDSGRVKIATAELLALLDNLDVAPDPVTGHPAGETFLSEQLSAALSGEGGPRYALAERDEDTLDLVFLFFEHLLAGGAIPDPIKVLIGRMQIPVAKMALLDKTFFSDDTHPARVLINNIGRAAIGWSDADGRDADSLFGMIERVIERLLLDFDGDPKLFARLDRYFRAFLAREVARGAGVDGDTPSLPREGLSIGLRSAGGVIVDADRAGVSVDADPAQTQVAGALADRLAPYAQIPGAVEVILYEGWSAVLLAIHRTRGADSPDWQAALELIDRLLWSVTAKRTAEERRQLLHRIPHLLETLRRQLAEVGCDPRLTARWLGELQTLHLDVLQGSARGAVLGGSDAETERSIRASSPVPCGCAIGDWIDWACPDGGRVRLNLVAWNPARDELLFFDRQGRRPTRFSARGLAEAIGAGRVSILGNGETPLADQALRAMLTSLSEVSFDG